MNHSLDDEISDWENYCKINEINLPPTRSMLERLILEYRAQLKEIELLKEKIAMRNQGWTGQQRNAKRIEDSE